MGGTPLERSGLPWPEALVVAFCAGYCVCTACPARATPSTPCGCWPGRRLSRRRGALRHRIVAIRWPANAVELWRLVVYGYFISDTSSDLVNAAMRLIESLLLFRAVATGTRSSGLRIATRLVGSLRASVAAGLNLLRQGRAPSVSAARPALCGCS